MRLKSLVFTLALVLVTLAGCISADPAPEPQVQDEPPAPEPPAVPDVDFATAIPDLHPHENHALHVGGYYLEHLGFNDLTDKALQQGIITGQYNEVDVCDDLAVVGSFAGNRGFTLVDISDPADPTVLSQFPTASTNWDVRLSDDCSTVFVGMELGALGGEPLDVTILGVGDAGRGGILVVDISDPMSPVRESYNPATSSHNVFSIDIDNETYVLNEDGYVGKLVGERGARTLEKVGQFAGVHDVSAAFHPETGVPYLFTGTSDLSIWDMSDPSAITPDNAIGTLDDAGINTLWHEQSPAPAMVDGRWVLVGAGENGNGEALPYTIVDITDPTTPTILGDWMLPGAPFETRGFYTFSPHNVAVREDGRVALANYHAGIWVIDISTQERQAEPVTLGYHFPSEIAPAVARSLPYAPYVWGADWKADGTLVIADLNTGLYTYGVA